jgi:hypothetical protein
MMTAYELRLRNLEETIGALGRERREDRRLLKELLSQILTLTDKQTTLLQTWTSLLAERQHALRIEGKPKTFTRTEADEYREYMEKHHPEVLEREREVDYNSPERRESEPA